LTKRFPEFWNLIGKSKPSFVNQKTPPDNSIERDSKTINLVNSHLFQEKRITNINQKKSRVCNLCRISYPLNKDYFGHTPKGNFRFQCRQCMNQRTKKWSQKNPESVNLRSKKRKRNIGNWKPSNEFVRSLYFEQNGICPLCGVKMKKEYLNRDYCQVEHLFPVSRGGTNKPSNLVLAHRKCNQEKSDKDIKEYFLWRRKVGLPLPKVISEKLRKVFNQ
tara:strand:- start:242 stop:898 length:657 start_codon:yes stop_codon:yes gene_type:complete